MTLPEFELLSYARQLAEVLVNGAYLAQRRVDTLHGTHLYLLSSGLFVELHFEACDHTITHLFAFEACREQDQLEAYTTSVQLPGWMPEAE